MRYPSNSTPRRLSANSITPVCPHHTATLQPRTLGFRRSASVGCPNWPSSPTMPVTSTTCTKRQAHSAVHVPAKTALKKRALAPRRANSLHSELECFNFHDSLAHPNLLMPTLSKDREPIQLSFRSQRSCPVVQPTVQKLPLMPTLADDKDDYSVCLSPRSTLKPMFEPPAPPSGEPHHVISFDASELSDDLFLPLDGW